MGLIIPIERIREKKEGKKTTEYIERNYVLKCMEDSYKNAGISAEARAKMTRWLNKAPAADVRPVVKAKWEDVHIDRPEIADLEVASMFCPNCNRWYNKIYHYGNPSEFVNFCSFCGADMREES